MKLLVLGGRGMAGHVVTSFLKKNSPHDVLYTSRDIDDTDGYYLDAADLERVKEMIFSIKPDAVINCIGILNHFADQDPGRAILINSYLPHYVASLLDTYGGKFIHISTDCVFSGKKGDYSLSDEPDGTSLYARTKILGEVKTAPHLTIRTSIIGPELKNGIGLLHWFLKQTGTIKGFTNVYWNGVTTLQLAKTILEAAERDLSGIIQLSASGKLSKYELLALFQKTFNKQDVMIEKYSDERHDKSLINGGAQAAFLVPSYEVMLQELKEWMDSQ
ncbi:dTDP-4-dehydrorhamnose reductase family protein [Fictibacillus iocasae]|uniref:dTDP-4-dehydrorhamnose reductase n=1 Tax=Fictibacillus iocasae TaxID=2715437 RepID=A0ABW2NR75_9BACL